MRYKEFLVTRALKESLNNWDETSIDKFAKTIGKNPKDHGFFDTCVLHMSKDMSKENAQKMCAKIKDMAYDSTMWRGKDKSKTNINKDTK